MNKFLPKSAKNPQGFTLVELMVVVSIIAILSVIGITVFTGIQKGARDSRRKADVQAISKSLEAHYNDATCGASPTNPYCDVTASNAAILFANGVIPTNPSPGGAAYTTVRGTTGNTYTICAQLENNTGNYNDAGTTAAPANNGSYFCIKNQQ